MVPRMPIRDIKRQCRIMGDKLLYPGNQLPWIIERLEKCESALCQVYGDSEVSANEDAYNYMTEHGLEKISEYDKPNVSEPEIHKLRCPVLSCRSNKIDWIRHYSNEGEYSSSTCCRCGHRADSNDFYEENQK